ncbi:MAG: xylulose 5-phosphate 3-epimerase [Planctomycetes bacterium]|nr:xylulose 5-phosphate 3-epimerase [Planctomycetota bacterium]
MTTNTPYLKTAAECIRQSEPLASWSRGYGAIRHTSETICKIHALADRYPSGGAAEGGLFEILEAADRLACAAMWLVAHSTYAHNVYLDGRDLEPADFKEHPEGHTGGALNMAIAYVGYLAANAIAGRTRSWLMGQGHTVNAIDSVNLLVNNLGDAHAKRYRADDAGLTRFVRDFYNYQIGADGRPESPLGSHVNIHTAGGLIEGGYLGFAELLYVHMPLAGERLVVFLSDGAFEEQRGSDWAARWWRASDCGFATPLMISNGRRIDQRTTMSMQGGAGWFQRHLKLNGFDPFIFDGRDPAAFVWAILESEERLQKQIDIINNGGGYPVALPYGIAVTTKGYGFPGAGTNAAHNLPLVENPRISKKAAKLFHRGVKSLHVPPAELARAVECFSRHARSARPRERDHALANRNINYNAPLSIPFREAAARGLEGARACPMAGVDDAFIKIIEANPKLRVRVGNPDELRSNRMGKTLDLLKHRVTDPEPGIAESVDGRVITALNEEAVAAAALGNEGGLNMIVSYEAFAAKMHGILRQKIIFTQQMRAAGRAPGWASVPVLLTSHLWENGKNEHSHQDPGLGESLYLENGAVSRVVFPADYNSAAAAVEYVYSRKGEIWTIVNAKQDSIPDLFTKEEARALGAEGAVRLRAFGYDPQNAKLALAAMGSYQWIEAAKASRRLSERRVPHVVNYIFEPAKLRIARDDLERAVSADPAFVEMLFPISLAARVFLVHGHPELFVGSFSALPRGAVDAGLGYQNAGGTLDTGGMLFMNRCTWAHALERSARLLGVRREEWLSSGELDALDGKRPPANLII